MRISKTLISGAVASVAVAGSANAAVTTYVLDSFNTNSTAGLAVNATSTGDNLSIGFNWTNWGHSSASNSKTIRGQAPAITGQPAQTYVFATATQAAGSVTMSVNTSPNNGTIGTGPNPSVRYRYEAASGTFDLSGKGNVFYFDGLTNDVSNGKWMVRVAIGSTNYDAIISDVGTLVNGRYHVNFSSLMAGSTAWTTGYNNVARVLIGLKASSNIVNSSISGSMGEFGIIPAPGAIALLGAAGLVGARRRR